MMDVEDYSALKFRLDGLLGPGEQHKRGVLLDAMYAFLPKEPEAKVFMFHAEIAPLGYTNWHRHNGATFFLCTQGLFEAHFEEGTLVEAKAGDVYSEPIGKFHRGHNPHPELAYTCIGLCLTSPHLEHITSVAERPW